MKRSIKSITTDVESIELLNAAKMNTVKGGQEGGEEGGEDAGGPIVEHYPWD